MVSLVDLYFYLKLFMLDLLFLFHCLCCWKILEAVNTHIMNTHNYFRILWKLVILI
jgi:hypothetical protein